MAQFFQVVSTDDGLKERATQFYSNVDDSQKVQYVITHAHGPEQHFAQQPQILMSGDQVMVLEGDAQQVIVNPSQLTFQQSQFVANPEHVATLNGVDFQPVQLQTSQAYFVENNPIHTTVVSHIEPTTLSQPVVLDRQLHTQEPAKIVNVTQHQPTMQNSTSPNRNILQGVRRPDVISQNPPLPGTPNLPVRAQFQRVPLRMVRTPPTAVRPSSPMPQPARPPPVQLIPRGAGNNFIARMPPPNAQQKTPLHVNTEIDQNYSKPEISPVQYPQSDVKLDQVTEHDKQNAVSLDDGSVISIASFKEMLLEKDKKVKTSPKKARNPSARGRAAVEGLLIPRSKPKLTRQPQDCMDSMTNQAIAAYALTERYQQPGMLNKTPYSQNPTAIRQMQQRQAVMAASSQQANPAAQNQRASQNNYLIQPPKPNRPQRPLPSFIASSQIQKIIESTPVGEEYSDSIRMLVLLANGEQRLITFTLPKEACTIQEILEQVGVPLQADTNIEVTEANSDGINYVVTVGNVTQMYNTGTQSDPIDSEETETSEYMQNTVSPEPRSPSPEPVVEQPKYIPGKLAVCPHCGYLSEDFNKCMRCKRKLLPTVKAIDQNSQESYVEKRGNFLPGQSNGKKESSPTNMSLKKRYARQKAAENETVVLSSDEEEDESSKASKACTDNLLQKLGSSVTLCPIRKEPSMSEIQKASAPSSSDGAKIGRSDVEKTASIYCRTVRIGSYRFVPPENVSINTYTVIIRVPHPKNEKEIKTIVVDRPDIVKVLISFQKQLPVIFYYLRPYSTVAIRNQLGMNENSEYYFDSLSENESQRRITILPEVLTEEAKSILQRIYTIPPHIILEELTSKEANDILIKTCPKELTESTLNSIGLYTEVKHLLTYPSTGKGRISINTEDYTCLATDQFLNDVIIDFYLKYIVDTLNMDEQSKVHVFSTFFYKRLTTKPVKASKKSQPAESDPNLSSAEKRHCRVKTWTKNIDLFSKDFIIIPINENSHWFLAIICFPGMDGCQTIDGQPIKFDFIPKKTKKTKTPTNVTISPVKREEERVSCDEESDKDEAEGDESELESDDSEDPFTQTVTSRDERPPIKQPCILIFDSLAGASRSRVVATLRDYLTCEYKAKTGNEKVFSKDVIKGACPKVPQQTNFTDCGLYLLQYVEQFFLEPIKDFYIPINHLKNWFDEMTVTRKREEISILIRNLMLDNNRDIRLLPDIILPTKQGQLYDHLTEPEDEFDDPIDDESKKESEMESSGNGDELNANENAELQSPFETPFDNNSVPKEPAEKPATSSNVPKLVSTTDTLSYLKAKRIDRHKNNDGPDSKKIKTLE